MLGLTACSGQTASPGTIDVIQIEGLVDPSTATYLVSKLRQAEDDGVQAAVIEIDTSGGLDVSTDEIVRQIVESDVPIVSWVAPNGARAASTGTFVVYASDLAFMADPSELGPAYPVNLAAPVPDPLDGEAMDDAVAVLRELATAQGRAPDRVEQVAGEPTDAAAAADAGMIDGTASSLADLLEQVDGADVQVAGGSDVVIESWNEDEDALSTSLRFQNPTLLQQLLHLVTDPEVAFFLLLVGLFGLIFEVYNPGIGLAGPWRVVARNGFLCTIRAADRLVGSVPHRARRDLLRRRSADSGFGDVDRRWPGFLDRGVDPSLQGGRRIAELGCVGDRRRRCS